MHHEKQLWQTIYQQQTEDFSSSIEYEQPIIVVKLETLLLWLGYCHMATVFFEDPSCFFSMLTITLRLFFFSWLINSWPMLNGWLEISSELVVEIYFCFFWQTKQRLLYWEMKIEFLDPLERHCLMLFFLFTMCFVRVCNLAIFFQLNCSC